MDRFFSVAANAYRPGVAVATDLEVAGGFVRQVARICQPGRGFSHGEDRWARTAGAVETMMVFNSDGAHFLVFLHLALEVYCSREAGCGRNVVHVSQQVLDPRKRRRHPQEGIYAGHEANIGRGVPHVRADHNVCWA